MGDSEQTALKILFCIAKCRQSLGRSMITDVLRARHSVRVFNRRLYLLSSFGSLREHTEEELNAAIDQLIADGLLEETEDEYPRLLLTEAGQSLLHAHTEDLAKL